MLRFTESEATETLQKCLTEIKDVYDIHHYKTIKKYLTLLGVDPYNHTQGSRIRVKVVLFSMTLILFPTGAQFYVAANNKDVDGMIEELPHIIIALAALIKYTNLLLNKKQFSILFDCITKDWTMLNSELPVLDKITKRGSRLASLYRNSILSMSAVFVYVPLLSPTLDIILPLNETRPRQQLIQANYIFINADEYFYTVYFHCTWSALIAMLIVVTVDSVYILITHHASGLFDVCGYQIEMATTNTKFTVNGNVLESSTFDTYKQCVLTHHNALQFYGSLQKCSQNMNLIQVGLNMITISLTAVQIVMYADRPAEVLRFVLFLIGQKFHLFSISLNGEVLLNHALMLTSKMYSTNWYNAPVKFQKMLHMIQIRCNQPCILKAGGLYDMNIENFGVTVKACMSYFTMFLSLRG